MKITVKNYESFFLDYHEGTLSAEDSAELFLFLEQHAELKEEFESFENISFADEPNDAYPDKESLKKISVPSFNNIDEWLIAELEGDLTLQQRTLLLNFLAENPQFQQQRILFKKSVVEPDMSVVFADKNSLRKDFIRSPVSTNRTWYYAAASVVVLLGAWFGLRVITADHTIETADKNPVVNPVETSIKTAAQTSQKRNAAQTTPSSDSSIQKKNNSDIDEKLAQDIKKEIKRVIISSDVNVPAISHNQKNDHKEKETLRFSEEKIDLLDMKLTAGITEEAPFVFVERRYIPVLPANYTSQENNFAAVQEKVLAEVKDFAASNINKATGEELLATTENDPKLPFKSRFIRFATSLVGKATGDKVKIKTAFDPVNGNIAAYELEMGKNKWQKQF